MNVLKKFRKSMREENTITLWQNECERLKRHNEQLISDLKAKENEMKMILDYKQQYEELLKEGKCLREKYIEAISVTEKITNEYKEKLEKEIFKNKK